MLIGLTIRKKIEQRQAARLTSMTPAEEIIPDTEIERVHGNANFGPTFTKRGVVNLAVLKCASGWYQGHTSASIAIEHGLITDHNDYKLTAKGRSYLWAVFSKGASF